MDSNQPQALNYFKGSLAALQTIGHDRLRFEPVSKLGTRLTSRRRPLPAEAGPNKL